MAQPPDKSIFDAFTQWFQNIPSEMWKGAFIGALVSAVFVVASSFLRKAVLKVKSQFPIRRILGDISDNDSPCSIFLKELYSQDGYYYSSEPDFFHLIHLIDKADGRIFLMLLRMQMFKLPLISQIFLVKLGNVKTYHFVL